MCILGCKHMAQCCPLGSRSSQDRSGESNPHTLNSKLLLGKRRELFRPHPSSSSSWGSSACLFSSPGCDGVDWMGWYPFWCL